MINNQQRPEPRAVSDGSQVLLHSVFDTIQGEGPFSGFPATFIRLAGCNLQCPLCDTEYTKGAQLVDVVELTRRKVIGNHNNLIVITGGEPLRQNITQLIDKLYLVTGAQIQIETNGNFPFMVWEKEQAWELRWREEWLHIVVSPKTHWVHPNIAQNALAYKYVVRSGEVGDDGIPDLALGNTLAAGKKLARPPKGFQGAVFIHPADEQDEAKNALNLTAAVEATMKASKHWPGARVGLQLHKYLGME